MRVGNRTRNSVGGLVDVEILFDDRGNGLDLGAELLLYPVQVEPVFPVDQIDGQAQMSKTTRSTNAVQIRLSVLWEIEVDDNVDSLDIDTTSQQIGADKVSAYAIPEIVENTVAVVLEHASVRVEAGVSQLSDLLSQQLDTVGGVTEDDRLVDLQLVEQGVQAMDLLLLLYESVVLGNTAEGELVHQVDLVGRVHMLVLEVLHHNGEGRTEEHHLPVLRVEAKELLDDGSKLGGQELIGFIHDERLASCEISYTLTGKIQDPAWCSNNNVDGLAQSNDIVLQPCSTGANHDVDSQVLSQGLADLRCLESQFSGGHKDERLCLRILRVDAFESGNNESRSLSSAILRSRKDVSSGQGNGNGLFLDRRRLLKACLEDTHHKLALDKEILELETFRRRNILHRRVSQVLVLALRLFACCRFCTRATKPQYMSCCRYSPQSVVARLLQGPSTPPSN